MIHVVWEFRVRPEKRQEFEQIYGCKGTWAQLFSQDARYRGTILSRDTEDPNRYLTTDTWDSLEAYRAFASKHAEEYQELDDRCENLTDQEICHGYFEQL